MVLVLVIYRTSVLPKFGTRKSVCRYVGMTSLRRFSYTATTAVGTAAVFKYIDTAVRRIC